MGKFDKVPFYEPGKPPRTDLLATIDFRDELELAWGKNWGAQSQIGKLRAALVSRPTQNELCEEAKEDPVHFLLPAGLPDLELMKKQHDAMVKVLKDDGVEVHYLEVPEAAYGPYSRMRMLWATASAFVINGGAIIPRYGLAPWRRGPEVLITKKLVEIGCPILYTIHGKGVLELGGNGIWLDPKHLIVGIGPSGNLEGVAQVHDILHRAGVEEIHLAYFTGAIHLDLVFGLADAWLGVIDKRHIDHETIVYLRRKDIKLIEAPPEECANSACNLLAIEPGKVIIPKRCDRTSEALRKEGVKVIELEMSEFIKTGGAAHCAVGELIRDPGPFLGGK